MKQLNIILTALIAGCFFLSSCVNETIYPDKEDVIEGLPVTMTLPYSAGPSMVVTKADGDDTVHDLYVLIFNKAGEFEQANFFSAKDQTLNTATKTVKLTATTGEKKVFAIANVTASNFNSETYSKNLKAELDAFCAQPNKNLADWKAKTVSMASTYTDWSPTELLMSGRFCSAQPTSTNTPTSETGDCIFKSNGVVADANGVTSDKNKIWLSRTVSSIKFNISAGIGIEFTPESWTVVNLSKSVNLFDDNRTVATDVFNPAFDSKIDGGTFQFYMLENTQANGTGLTDDTREALCADTEHKGAYIILKGKYKGSETNPFFPAESPKQTATANVTYYIHLGHVAEYGGLNDLSVYRNHEYTYNVRVVGVSDIIVEAIKEGDTPRADGDVSFTESEVFDVDAHYSRVLLSFNPKTNFLDENGKLVCKVKTNQTGGEISVDQQGADIDWIYFVEKSKVDALWSSGKGPNFTLTGEARQSAGIYNIKELATVIADKINNGETNTMNYYAYISEHYYDKGNLADFINFDATTGTQKTRIMKIAMQSSSNATQSSSVTSARFTITQKPIVTIYDMTKRTRTDKVWGVEWVNESLAEKYYTTLKYPASTAQWKEKSITTGIKFNVSNVYFNVKGASYDDGYANAQTELSNYINKTSRGWKALVQNGVANINADNSNGYGNTAYAFAACMSRNRDENGDGVIDGNEIKWYLPAINQYQHFWVGTNAVPEEATLYPADFRKRNEGLTKNDVREMFTFVSSGGHRFFADESFGVRLNDENRHYNHIRCARNIGEGNVTPLAQVTDGKNINNKDYKIYTVENSLTTSSLRDKMGALPSHNENSVFNKLSKKFAVMVDLVTPTDMGTTASQYPVLLKKLRDDKNYNPCDKYNINGETGWRAPNQRELIMYTTSGGFPTGNVLFVNTFSTLWNFEGTNWERKAMREEDNLIAPATRWGYIFMGTEMQLPFPVDYAAPAQSGGLHVTQQCNIRCVKDLE